MFDVPPRLPYLLMFGLSAVTSIAAGWWVRKRYDAVGTRELAFVLFGVGLWAANSFARVVFSDSTVTHVLLSTEVFFGVVAAVLWFRFTTRYTDCRLCDTDVVRYGLFGFAVVALLVPLSDPIHGQMWTAVTPVERSGLITYEVGRGVGHYALTVSAYLVVLVGSYYLVALLWTNAHSRPAILALLSGFALLVGANALPYVATDMLINHSTTITPLGATFFAVGAAVAIHYNLFSVAPVARERVVTAVLDPLVVLDADGRPIESNHAFERAFGEHDPRVPFDEAFPTLAANVDLESDSIQSVTVEHDGEPKHYSVSTSTVESGPHRLGSALVFRDVTPLVEAREELERQNTQLDEFASTAAHNLRNPLGIIAGYTELLETHLDASVADDHDYDPALVETSLTTIGDNARRMDDILTDLLRVTREGKTLTHVESVPFGEVARFALTAVDDDGRIDLRVERDGTIRADARRLEKLLFAVFRSACDRADVSTTVRVTLTDDGFVIDDTSTPVPPEDVELLLNYGYSTKYQGTGLGLSVARTLAAVHQWTLRLDTGYRDGVRIVVEEATTTLQPLEQS